MAEGGHIYGEIDGKTDLEKVFKEIRSDVEDAKSRQGLTELYRRAGYLITLSQAPSWGKKFGDRAGGLRRDAEKEFGVTARAINRRARGIGEDGDYDERWGK